jgi:four helix bundle protein
MSVRSYRDLIAWQKAMDFTVEVYQLSKNFPAEERFALTTQLRRSAVSVPSNIAEGEGRFSKPDFSRFLSFSHGSLCESETQIILADRLGYVSTDRVDAILAQSSEVGRLIRGLARSLNTE